MDDIRKVLRTAARRLEFAAFISRAHVLAIIAAAIVLVLILADRAPAESFVPWLWVAPATFALCFALALLLTLRRRQSELHVAVQVDERLDLREKLSTALQCQQRSDAFARAAIEDAVAVARDARTLERTRRAFRPGSPRGWWVSPLIVFLAIVTAQLHQFDLFAEDAAPDQPEIQKVKAVVQENLSAIIKGIEENPELRNELDSELADLAGKPGQNDPLRTPEQVKRDAIKKVTDLNRKLEEIVKGEKGRTNEAIETALAKLTTPSDGPAREFAESLQKGDFKAAQESLQNMMEQIQKGEMNAQEQEQLAKQLEQLADQLNQLAQQQQQLQQALQAAGMDQQLANNPQALQQALQNNQNLNQQQKQQLQQMAQAQQQCNNMMQGLGQACQNMAQGMQGGQGMQQQMQQGAQMAQQQLGQMEQLQQLMQQAQATMNQCQGQCQGMGQGLAMQQFPEQGNGMGQWGQGSGGNAPVAKTPSGFQLTKADVKTDPTGELIAKQVFFDGPVVKGESKAKMARVLTQTLEGYDEAQVEEEVPVQYRDAHKHYFGELEKKVQEVIRRSDDAPPAGESTEAGSEDS